MLIQAPFVAPADEIRRASRDGDFVLAKRLLQDADPDVLRWLAIARGGDRNLVQFLWEERVRRELLEV